MKKLSWFAWISVIIAVVLMFLGLIDLLFPKLIFVNHVVNYYHVANSFLLLAICIVLIDKCKGETESET